MTLAAFFLVNEWFGETPWQSFCYLKWTFLTFICVVLYAYRLSKDIHWALFMPVAWTLLSGLYVWGFDENFYNLFQKRLILEQRQFAAIGAFTFLLLTSVMYLYRKTNKADVMQLLGRIAIWLSLWVIFFRGIGINSAGPLGNKSMSCCLIAVLFPFMVNYCSYFWFPLPFIAVGLSQASQPPVLLGLVILLMAGNARRFVTTIFLPCAAVALGLWVVSAGVDGMGESLLSSAGRFEQWRVFGKHFLSEANPLFGLGLSQTIAVLPHLDLDKNISEKIWYWLHSDWLESLFCLGLIGFISYLILFITSAREALKKDRNIFASVVTYGAYAACNFPTHLPISAAVGVVLVWLALV